MTQRILGEGVRFERVSTPRELESSLDLLPNGVRFGIACELDERGQALRMDGRNQCVHYLHWDGDDIVMLTWGPLSTLFEAAILLSSVKTVSGPIDEETAVQLYRGATSRRAEFLVEPKRHPPVAASDSWSQRAVQRLCRYLRLRWRPSAVALPGRATVSDVATS
jgi:hypothetical protein